MLIFLKVRKCFGEVVLNSTACRHDHQNRKDVPPIGSGKEMSQANQSMRGDLSETRTVLFIIDILKSLQMCFTYKFYVQNNLLIAINSAAFVSD